MAYPTRVEPRADGKAQNPPSGGSWLRDEDGGLTPADEATAAVWHAAFGHVAQVLTIDQVLMAALIESWSLDTNGFQGQHAGINLVLTTGDTISAPVPASAFSAPGLLGNALYTAMSGASRVAAVLPRSHSQCDLTAGSVSMVCWIKGTPGNTSAGWNDRMIMGRGNNPGSLVAWLVAITGSDPAQLAFGVSSSGSSADMSIVPADAKISASEWCMVCASIDVENGIIRMMARSESFNVNETAPLTALPFAGSNANFCVSGSMQGDSVGYATSNDPRALSYGLIDQPLVFSKALNQSEFDYLYNNGAGRAYPFQ